MKKIFKNPIFTFILGAVIFSTLSVFAYSIIAQDVGFTPKDDTWKNKDGTAIENVKEALDDLYFYAKKEDFTGDFYLSGTIDGSGYSRTSYVDINVSNYKFIKFNITGLFTSNTSVFTCYILADGERVRNITSLGEFTLDVQNNKKIRLYYYENDGYYFVRGTYTLQNYLYN